MGDTCSGDMMAPLAMDADLLIHEATNAWFREQVRDIPDTNPLLPLMPLPHNLPCYVHMLICIPMITNPCVVVVCS